jgi:uroporphyrinogen-III decarboxylase
VENMKGSGRKFYLDTAARGIRMPIGADLVLRESPNPEAIVLDGEKLGAVVAAAARRYRTPIAVPLMDLTIEKESMLDRMGMTGVDIHKFLFDGVPDGKLVDSFDRRLGEPPIPRARAQAEAVGYIARNTDLVPVGMVIGPFSLLVKVLNDPISAVYMGGTGLSAEDSDEVAALEKLLDLCVRTVMRSVEAQVAAGAKAICEAEPAANGSYISPKQMAAGSDVFEKYVMAPNRRLKRMLDEKGVDLIFHCCGETTDAMVRHFTELRPVMLSLGKSRTLWKDAALVPQDIVLYGNLPTRQFMMDSPTLAEVEAMARDLVGRMRTAGHPFILGSECDVLSVPGREKALMDKVMAFVNLGV